MKRSASLVEDSLPTHVKHFINTCLFESLDEVLREFVGAQVVPSDAASALVCAAATALEDEFENPPLSLSAFTIGPGSGI